MYLKTDPLGNLNLVQALSPPEPEESTSVDSGIPFNVVIRKLNVLKGFFHYQTAEDMTEAQKDRMVLQNVNLTIEDANLLKEKARLTSEITGGNIAGNKIDRIHLSCRLTDRCLTLDSLNLYTVAGRFDLKGQVDFKKAFSNGFISSHPDLNAISYHLSLRQKDSVLETMPFNVSGIKGSITSLMELKGTGINPKELMAESTLELFARNLSAGKAFSPLDAHVTAQAIMEKGRVTLHQLDARADETHLKVAGNYDISSREIAADFKFNTPDLAHILSVLGIKSSGKIDTHGMLEGTLTAPVAHAQLQAENLGFEQVKIGDANATIQFSQGMLSLDHGKIRNHNSSLDISGTVRISDPVTGDILKTPGLKISLNGDALFIEDFVEGVKGKLTLNGQISGDTAHPLGQLNLKGQHVEVYTRKVQEVRLTSDLDGCRFNLDPLEIVIAPGENVLLQGWISLNKDYHLQVASQGISLKNLIPLGLENGDTGKVSFSFQGQGGLENPQINGQVVLKELRFNNQPLQDERFQIEIKDRTANITGGQNIALDATYHLQTHAFSASARFDNTNLTPYLKIAGTTNLNGSITGKLHAAGNARLPDQIKGSADISGIEIFSKKTPLLQAGQVKVFFKHKEISIAGVRLNLFERGTLNLKGTCKLNGDLDINARGNFPLEVIAHLSDGFPDAAGDVLFSLYMNGNLSQPYIRADAEMKNCGMTVPGLLQSMHDLNGRIRVTPEAVVLDNIRGMLDSGSFELLGAIDLKAFRPSRLDLMLKAHDLPLMIPDTLETRLNAELDIRGTPEKSVVSGDIQMIEGKYYKDIRLNLAESLGKKSREQALPASEIPWSFLKNMTLDITTRYREPFIVDNNMALLALKPDLRLYGSVNQPLISGRAQIESGTVYFQKKEFTVKKGVFDFINPYKIEPAIDVQSQMKIREWTVFLNISGTPDNLKFTLSSDPWETQENILSLLITGRTTQELIANEGGLSRSSTQILADILAETAQKQIKDATGLDVVELEYTEATEPETSDEVKVTVGKELSQRVTVKYGMQTKNARVIQQVITEYKFLENLLINAFQDTEGHYGGGLQFRLEFR
jgi:autotransporter translocation and assembly factor TamB